MKKNYAIIAFTLLLNSVNAQIHIGPTQTYANIQAACPFIQPGDTVYIHAGTYAGYQYYDGLKGNANNWITITRYKNESHEIRGAWQFSNMEYVKMEKLKFKANANFPGGHINIDNKGDCAYQSKHIILDSCYFLDVTAGGNTVKFGGVDEFEVKNCVIKIIPVLLLVRV